MSRTVELDRAVITESASQVLARFLAGMRFEALPAAVVSRTEEDRKSVV